MAINPEQKKLNFTKSNQALVKLQKGNLNFEIIVSPKEAFNYIQNSKNVSNDENTQIPDIIDVLEIDIIWSDASRGERANENDLTFVFESNEEEKTNNHLHYEKCNRSQN